MPKATHEGMRVVKTDQTYQVRIDPATGDPIVADSANGKSARLDWGTIIDLIREKGIDQTVE